MRLYLKGWELAERAWRSDNATGSVIAGFAEVMGGALLEGFNDGLAFLSFLGARSLT